VFTKELEKLAVCASKVPLQLVFLLNPPQVRQVCAHGSGEGGVGPMLPWLLHPSHVLWLQRPLCGTLWVLVEHCCPGLVSAFSLRFSSLKENSFPTRVTSVLCNLN
jgi:hypothetical protein